MRFRVIYGVERVYGICGGVFFMMSLTLFQKEDGSFITCEGNGYWGFMCVQIEDFVNV